MAAASASAASSAAAALVEETDAPPDLRFPCQVFDIAFHPTVDVLAAGLINGKLELFSYGPGSCKRLVSADKHTGAIRTVKFLENGNYIFTGSSDRSIKCFDATGTVVWQAPSAHDVAVNVIQPFGEHFLASGDEDGGIRVWDLRVDGSTPSMVEPKRKHEDVVTDMLLDMDRATLVTASGDGSLGIYNLASGVRRTAQTEPSSDEFLSLAMIKDGSSVVAGTQKGTLCVFDWGHWAPKDDYDTHPCPERFRGHPESIEAILPVDADTVVTGSSDGIIRVVTIRPNKLVGLVGEHGDEPIEQLAWSRDRRYIASASHDNMVRFWDVAWMHEAEEEEAGAGEDGEGAAGSAAAGGDGSAGAVGQSRFTRMKAIAMGGSMEDSDDDDDDDDDDSDDDDEEGGTAAAAAGGRAAASGGGSAMAAGGAGVEDEDDDDDDDDDDEDDEDGMGARLARAGRHGGGRKKGGRRKGGRGGGGSSAGGGARGFYGDL